MLPLFDNLPEPWQLLWHHSPWLLKSLLGFQLGISDVAAAYVLIQQPAIIPYDVEVTHFSIYRSHLPCNISAQY